MICHTVFLYFNDKVSDQAIADIDAAFVKLANDVEQIRYYAFGQDAKIIGGNADYALVAHFETAEDFKAYNTHPAHLKLIDDFIKPYLADFKTVQFELKTDNEIKKE